jgi:hypothetical protein
MHNKGNTPSEDIVAEAISENMLYQLFVGEFSQLQSPHASVPTDSHAVFESWVLYVGQQSEPKSLWARFEELVLEISKDDELCWFAVLYLHDFLEYAKRNDVGEDVSTQIFIDQTLANIIDNRESLARDYKWVGSELYSFSVWNYVCNMVEVFSREYPYDFKAQSFR